MTLALILVSVLAAGAIVGFIAEEINRRERKPFIERLQMQLAADEEQLDDILGPRPGVDANDPWRAV